MHLLASLLDNRNAVDALLAWSPWSCRRAVVGEGWAMPGPEEGLGKDRCAGMKKGCASQPVCDMFEAGGKLMPIWVATAHLIGVRSQLVLGNEPFMLLIRPNLLLSSRRKNLARSASVADSSQQQQ
jgi:hypothetical protein